MNVRTSFRAVVAVVIGALSLLLLTSTGASATVRTVSGTETWYCYVPGGDPVPITRDFLITDTKSGRRMSQSTLTNPITGITLSYTSAYALVSTEDGDYRKGPAILVYGEVEPYIVFLKGHAVVGLIGGGYPGSYTADRIVDVCAALGV